MSEETKITLGQRAEEKVKCCNCEKEILAAEGFTYQDDEGNEVYICAECRDAINREIAAETENPNMLRSLMVGSGAGLAGGTIWYFFTILTMHQVGWIAIALGWLIAQGTIFGAGHKRGKKIQFLSGFIAIATILLAEFMIFLHFAGQETQLTINAVNLVALFIVFITKWFSPMGLLICGLGIYMAYITPKARQL